MLQPDSSADFGVKFVVDFKRMILETFLSNFFSLFLTLFLVVGTRNLRILDFSRNELAVNSRNPKTKIILRKLQYIMNSLCYIQ